MGGCDPRTQPSAGPLQPHGHWMGRHCCGILSAHQCQDGYPTAVRSQLTPSSGPGTYWVDANWTGCIREVGERVPDLSPLHNLAASGLATRPPATFTRFGWLFATSMPNKLKDPPYPAVSRRPHPTPTITSSGISGPCSLTLGSSFACQSGTNLRSYPGTWHEAHHPVGTVFWTSSAYAVSQLALQPLGS